MQSTEVFSNTLCKGLLNIFSLYFNKANKNVFLNCLINHIKMLEAFSCATDEQTRNMIGYTLKCTLL